MHTWQRLLWVNTWPFCATFPRFPRPLKDAGIIDYFWDLTKWIKRTSTRQLQFGKRRRHKHAVQCVNVTGLGSCAGVFNLLAFITYQRDKIPVTCCQKTLLMLKRPLTFYSGVYGTENRAAQPGRRLDEGTWRGASAGLVKAKVQPLHLWLELNQSQCKQVFGASETTLCRQKPAARPANRLRVNKHKTRYKFHVVTRLVGCLAASCL